MRSASQNENSLTEQGRPHRMRPASKNEAGLTEWNRPHKMRPTSKNEAGLTNWGSLTQRIRHASHHCSYFINKCSVNKKIKPKQGTVELFQKLKTFFFNAKDSFNKNVSQTKIWHIQSQNIEICALRPKFSEKPWYEADIFFMPAWHTQTIYPVSLFLVYCSLGQFQGPIGLWLPSGIVRELEGDTGQFFLRKPGLRKQPCHETTFSTVR